MRDSYVRLIIVFAILFCAQASIGGKFCQGQVGMSWDSSYSAVHCGTGGTAAFDPLAFDPYDPNDVQRSILFDYYNANRTAIYSADGVSGWDTNRHANPLRSMSRRRKMSQNVTSRLGTGSAWIGPFDTRRFTRSQASEVEPFEDFALPPEEFPQAGSNDSNRGELPSPLAPPNLGRPIDAEMSGAPEREEVETEDVETEDVEANDVGTEVTNNGLTISAPIDPEPSSAERSLMEWDDSLDALPDLNQGLPHHERRGNPLPPMVGEINAIGQIHRKTTAPELPRLSPLASPDPRRMTPLPPSSPRYLSPLESAIQLQSGVIEAQPRMNPLQAAIALERERE